LDCQTSSYPELQFDVVATGSIAAGDRVAELRLEVRVDSGDVGIDSIEYPRISFRERALSSGGGVMALPFEEGELVLDPVHQTSYFNDGFTHKHPSNMAAMQMYCYYEEAEENPAVLFFGTRDLEGHLKELKIGPATADVGGVRERLPFQYTHIPEGHHDPSVTAFSLPYPVVLGVLRGDWVDAAKFYRSCHRCTMVGAGADARRCDVLGSLQGNASLRILRSVGMLRSYTSIPGWTTLGLFLGGNLRPPRNLLPAARHRGATY
jgi:hypothetical protein